jgi:hypothetical protein
MISPRHFCARLSQRKMSIRSPRPTGHALAAQIATDACRAQISAHLKFALHDVDIGIGPHTLLFGLKWVHRSIDCRVGPS